MNSSWSFANSDRWMWLLIARNNVLWKSNHSSVWLLLICYIYTENDLLTLCPLIMTFCFLIRSGRHSSKAVSLRKAISAYLLSWTNCHLATASSRPRLVQSLSIDLANSQPDKYSRQYSDQTSSLSFSPFWSFPFFCAASVTCVNPRFPPICCFSFFLSFSQALAHDAVSRHV